MGASPATFDYAKLDWMNGQYLRALDVDAYADALVTYLREQGNEWDEARIRAAAPIVQEKMGRLGEFQDFARFLFEDVEPDPALLDAAILTAAADELEPLEPWDAASLEAALKRSASTSTRSRGRSTCRFASPSRARGSRPGSTRASSSSGATSRSPGCVAAPRSPAGEAQPLPGPPAA